MAQIAIQQLTFGYEGSSENVFEGMNLSLDTDWRLGLIGRNGRGKTTLLRLLAGMERPDAGSIVTPVQPVLFPQPVADGSRTADEVAQDLLQGADWWRLAPELQRLALPPEVLGRPYGLLSPGERAKLQLAALFLRENSFLLIDEPTNHLDTAGRQRLALFLRDKPGFIIISHDRALLDGCADHILALNRQSVTLQRGNYSVWEQECAQRDAREAAQNERLKGEIKRMEQAARRTEGWSEQVEQKKKGSKNSGLRPDRGYLGHKAAKMMQRAKNIETRRQQALQQKQALLRDAEKHDPLKLQPLRYHSSRLVEAEALQIFYEGRAVFAPVHFTLTQGQRLCVAGPNGSGKSSLLQLLCGASLVHGGRLWQGTGVRHSVLSQEATHLCGDAGEYARQNGLAADLFFAILRKLDFPRAQFEKPMEQYSSGQKKKVLLAKSLCEPAHLYVWDEPLNFIDLLSRVQIEQLLLEFAPTMLFVEHDARFCQNIATQTLTLLPAEG